MSTEQYLLPNGRVLRYNYRERLVHWTAGIAYLYLLLTGLAFWSPWLFWIAVVLGGPTVSRELHPWAGVIFAGLTVLGCLASLLISRVPAGDPAKMAAASS